MVTKIFGAKVSCLLTLSAVVCCSSATFIFNSDTVLRTPDSAFTQLSNVGYPWLPKYTFYTPTGFPQLRLNYIDEGREDAPETLLLLHGTPVWSFLFREMIPTLLDAGYRVVVPDFVGCGRSDKLLLRERYTHSLHVQAVTHIIDTLGLKDITMVGHDLGGPIGSSALLERPDKFKRLVYFNTWLPQGDVFSSFSRFVDYIPYLGVRLMTLTLGYFQSIAAILLAVSDATLDEITNGYKAPYPDARYQGGIAAWPLMIPLKPEDELAVEMKKVADYVTTSWSGPALVGYSSGEAITIAGQEFLESVFPSSCKVLIPNAGHYLMEDEGPLVAETVVEFINGNCKANGR